MNSISPLHRDDATNASLERAQLSTFYLGDQLFGVSALQVRDILRQQPLTPVPLNPPEIAGTMNLRGHIVTAIDLRAKLGITAAPGEQPQMCVVVEIGDEQCSLIVDRVGDVIPVIPSEIEPNPSSLGAQWSEVSKGILRLPNNLLIILDIERLLSL